MKIKLSLQYFIAFFTLVFLVHEIHDWAHVLVARAFCGCWGTRAFDSWTPCVSCLHGGRGVIPATIAGPAVNYIIIWWGLALMFPEEPPQRQSLGFSLIMAALPLPRILGACSGGGDETSTMRQLFQHPGGSNPYIVAAAGLLIVLLLNIPALVRIFFLMPKWWGKLLVLPAFLVIPPMVDHWLVSVELNKLLAEGMFSRLIMRGVPQAIVFWLFFLIVIFLLTCRSLVSFFDYAEFEF